MDLFIRDECNADQCTLPDILEIGLCDRYIEFSVYLVEDWSNSASFFFKRLAAFEVQGYIQYSYWHGTSILLDM